MKKLIPLLAGLLIILFFVSAANQRTISGKITDNQGNALPGVSILAKSSKTAALSNSSGNYSISLKDSDNTLIFSYIGMKTQEVKIGTQNVLNIIMEYDEMELQEVVVVGYGVQKSRKLSGTMTSYVAAEYDSYMPAVHYPADFNTEGYSTIRENGFRKVLNEPLSTFSIDVDRASYSNIRRYINNGQLPPVDAVRIEEMINYFSYDYPKNEGKHPFSVYTELSYCPWNTDHQLLHIGLKGKELDKTELPPSNLVFLIDVSGSMDSPNKLGLVKSSMQMLVKELRPQDKVSIVVYAGAAGLVLGSTPGNQKEAIFKAIENLQAGGSTAGGQGLILAYKIAGENFIQGGNNRIILASDGDFNVGVSSNAEMERLVEKERDKGIFITVLGYGMGNYKDDKMEIIANKGNGNYAYIDNLQEARKTLVTEFAGTVFTIAKDVKFQLEFNPSRVKAYRLIGYENRLLNNEDFNNDKKDAGEMGVGHSVTALYEIIPAGSDADINGVDPLKYQSNPKEHKPDPNAELLTIKLRYKHPESNSSILYSKAVNGKPLPLSSASENFRFSAAVAEFGMVLRNSEHKGSGNLHQVIELAKASKGNDDEGYRSEFLALVRLAEKL
jgi:Ca-activated chloride channel homolog